MRPGRCSISACRRTRNWLSSIEVPLTSSAIVVFGCCGTGLELGTADSGVRMRMADRSRESASEVNCQELYVQIDVVQPNEVDKERDDGR